MNFIRNRNFRAGPQTSLEGFICPQNSDKQQKIKVFGRSGGGGPAMESLGTEAGRRAGRELRALRSFSGSARTEAGRRARRRARWARPERGKAL